MVLFKDINRSSTDLLTRDFVHERPWDVEFKHSAKNPTFIQNAYVNGSGTFEAFSTAKYSCQTGSLESKLGTTSSMFDAQYKVPYLPGLTLGSRFERRFHAKGASDVVEFSADHLAANGIHSRISMNPLIPSWTASAVTCVPAGDTGRAHIGAEATGSSDLRGIKYSIGGAFSQETKEAVYTASLRVSHLDGNPLGKLTANVHAKANKLGASEYAAEAEHLIASSKTNVSFGGMWYLDQPIEGSLSKTFFKAKFSQDAQVATSLTHKLSDSLTATVGAQINAFKGTVDPDSVKYGIRLNVLA